MTLTSLRDDSPRAERKRLPKRSTLYDFGFSGSSPSLHTVGRLDRDSEGLLLLTNDGKFTDKVKNVCEKKYWVLVRGNANRSAANPHGEPIQEESLVRMRLGGLSIRGRITRPPVLVRFLNHATTEMIPKAIPGQLEVSPDESCRWLEVILTEGRNRQIRRMTQREGYLTIRLVRVGIGDFSVGNMQPGEWRDIEPEQVF